MALLGVDVETFVRPPDDLVLVVDGVVRDDDFGIDASLLGGVDGTIIHQSIQMNIK